MLYLQKVEQKSYKESHHLVLSPSLMIMEIDQWSWQQCPEEEGQIWEELVRT